MPASKKTYTKDGKLRLNVDKKTREKRTKQFYDNITSSNKSRRVTAKSGASRSTKGKK